MRLLIYLFSITLFLSGCAQGLYKIPKDDYQQRVKILGVAPLLVDHKSDISHPEREEVIHLLREQNYQKTAHLIEKLKGQRDYFDVRPIPEEPERLFAKLIIKSSLKGEKPSLYRSYGYNPAGVRELCDKNVVDALLIITMNGVTRTEKRWDRGRFNYLEGTFNTILATAAVVMPSGEVVWEYPGGEDEGPFLELQYPAFDEAYYNKTDTVRIKPITAAGLERTLKEPGQKMFAQTNLPVPYQRLFERIASALNLGLINPFGAREKP